MIQYTNTIVTDINTYVVQDVRRTTFSSFENLQNQACEVSTVDKQLTINLTVNNNQAI